MKFTKALLVAGLCLFVTTQNAQAFEDKRTDRIAKVQQFLDNILTPLQDHMLTRLKVAIDKADTRIETPAISAEGTARFDRTFWDDQGATFKMRVKAVGKDIEVEDGDTKKKLAQSTFNISLKMQSETVALLNKSAAIGYKQLCQGQDQEDELKIFCDSLEKLEKAADIEDVFDALNPALRAIAKAGDNDVIPVDVESIGWDLDTFGEGRDSHIYLKLYLLDGLERTLFKGIKHASLDLVMDSNAAYLRLTAVVHHDRKILEDARKEIKEFSTKIATMPEDERKALEKKLIEKGQKASKEVKAAILTGEFGQAVFSLMELWATGLSDL